MRNLKLRREFLILTILALSLTAAPAMVAQQRSGAITPADSTQEERQAAPVDGKCQNYSAITTQSGTRRSYGSAYSTGAFCSQSFCQASLGSTSFNPTLC